MRILYFQGHPYYKLVQNNPSQQPAAVTSYLYWESGSNHWAVGPTLGGTDMKLKTGEFNRAKCPADLGNLKNWKYSGTLKWKDDSALRVLCQNF